MEHAEHRRSMPSVTAAESLVRHARAGAGTQALARLRQLGFQIDAGGDDPLHLAALRAETSLRMPDCLVVAAAERHHEPLATFDERLASVARGRGLEVFGDDASI